MARDSSAASPSVSMRNQVFGGASHTNCIATLPAFAPADLLPSPYFVAHIARRGDGQVIHACEHLVPWCAAAPRACYDNVISMRLVRRRRAGIGILAMMGVWHGGLLVRHSLAIADAPRQYRAMLADLASLCRKGPGEGSTGASDLPLMPRP